MDDEKDLGGRPLLYDSPEKLLEAITAYFAENKRPTLSGLALAIGMDRTSLYNYKKRDGFFDIIKNAQAKVESIYEERLVWDNCLSVIFPLKNMGWSDSSKTELSGPNGSDLIPPAISITVVKPGGQNYETKEE